MKENHENLENEIDDLKRELEHFQQERERVRTIVGKIGGMPKFQTKLINAIFIVIVAASVAISITGGHELRLLMIETVMVTLSAKIIYMIHFQLRVNHFQFWMLSSIEWRINEMMTLIRQLKK